MRDGGTTQRLIVAGAMAAIGLGMLSGCGDPSGPNDASSPWPQVIETTEASTTPEPEPTSTSVPTTPTTELAAGSTSTTAAPRRGGDAKTLRWTTPQGWSFELVVRRLPEPVLAKEVETSPPGEAILRLNLVGRSDLSLRSLDEGRNPPITAVIVYRDYEPLPEPTAAEGVVGLWGGAGVDVPVLGRNPNDSACGDLTAGEPEYRSAPVVRCALTVRRIGNPLELGVVTTEEWEDRDFFFGPDLTEASVDEIVSAMSRATPVATVVIAGPCTFVAQGDGDFTAVARDGQVCALR